jgi:hypothetical protein
MSRLKGPDQLLKKFVVWLSSLVAIVHGRRAAGLATVKGYHLNTSVCWSIGGSLLRADLAVRLGAATCRPISTPPVCHYRSGHTIRQSTAHCHRSRRHKENGSCPGPPYNRGLMIPAVTSSPFSWEYEKTKTKGSKRASHRLRLRMCGTTWSQ